MARKPRKRDWAAHVQEEINKAFDYLKNQQREAVFQTTEPLRFQQRTEEKPYLHNFRRSRRKAAMAACRLVSLYHLVFAVERLADQEYKLAGTHLDFAARAANTTSPNSELSRLISAMRSWIEYQQTQAVPT